MQSDVYKKVFLFSPYFFGGGQKKEEPKVGKLNPEAIKALANAKA